MSNVKCQTVILLSKRIKILGVQADSGHFVFRDDFRFEAWFCTRILTFQPQLLVSDPQNHLPATFDSIAHAALPFDLCLWAFGVDLATTDNERTRASTGARVGAMGAERSARCARTKNYYATQSRGRETAIWWLLSNRPLSTLRARAPLARWGRPLSVAVGGGRVDPSGARRPVTKATWFFAWNTGSSERAFAVFCSGTPQRGAKKRRYVPEQGACI